MTGSAMDGKTLSPRLGLMSGLVIMLALAFIAKGLGLALSISGAQATSTFPLGQARIDPQALEAARAPGDDAGGKSGQSAAPPAETNDETPAVDIASPGDDSVIVGQTASAEERRLLERLAVRRQALEARAQALDAQAQILSVQAQKIAEANTALESKAKALREAQAAYDARRSVDREAVISAYERMKPRDAAEIFNGMEDDLLLSVALGLRSQALAGILAEMAPARARHLTMLMSDYPGTADSEALIAAREGRS